jgi:hypothetical protein
LAASFEGGDSVSGLSGLGGDLGPSGFAASGSPVGLRRGESNDVLGFGIGRVRRVRGGPKINHFFLLSLL